MIGRLEESDASAEQHRDDVEVQLVDESRHECPANHGDAADDHGILITGGLTRSRHRLLDTVHEGEERAALVERVARLMRHHEDRTPKRRLLTPTHQPGVGHTTTHHVRAGC